MKFTMVILLGLVAFAASQPVDEAAIAPADDGAAIVTALEDESSDMMGSESILKKIEKKLDHWIKKCHKFGGCYNLGGYDYGYAQPSYGYAQPSYGYPRSRYGLY